MATVLFGPLIRCVTLTTIMTGRAWVGKPAWFWRPFTAASLIGAAVMAMFWPYLGGSRIYQAAFGAPPFQVSWEMKESFPVAYPMLCYIAWSLALAPHTIVRIVVLAGQNRDDRRRPIGSAK